jgi:1-acyl-sn-glycerol-3-phosphate acyltransferase
MPEELASMKAQVYKDPRPAEYFDKYHARARERDPDWVYDVARILLTPFCAIVFRARCIASDNVPLSGPAILAPNHFSFMDHFFVGMFLRRRVRFMAKSQLFSNIFKWILYHGGAFPVRRGHHDEETFVTGRKILERGRTIVMYCEGGRSRSGRLSERAKPGIGRLALESGAPVVPIAIYGSQKARNWKRFQFPKVTVQYGEPMVFERVEQPTREQQQAVADEVFAGIKELYADLEQTGRKGMVQRVREQRRAERRARRAATA